MTEIKESAFIEIFINTNINKKNKEKCFFNCSGLQAIVIPPFNWKKLTKITLLNSIYNCKSLNDVVMHESVKSKRIHFQNVTL